MPAGPIDFRDHLSGLDETRRPQPVEILLDENASTTRRSTRGASPRPAHRGLTARRTVAILVAVALVAAGLSRGFAHHHPSTPAARGAAVIKPLHEEPTDIAPPSEDTKPDLLASLDATTEAEIARVAATDGPQQVAAIQFLRQQRDEVRALILTHYRWLQ